MGKLSLPATRTAFASPRSAYATDTKAPIQTASSRPWKRLYSTKRWKALRQAILIRDAYTCAHCHRVCAGKSPSPDSPVVDHKRPHRGDDRLFWLETNLQVLCKSPCHDQHKQTLEQESLRHAGVWD